MEKAEQPQLSNIFCKRSLGRFIAIRRFKQGLTQSELAKKINVRQPYIVAIEKGKKNIPIETLLKIGEALRFSLITKTIPGEKRKGEFQFKPKYKPRVPKFEVLNLEDSRKPF